VKRLPIIPVLLALLLLIPGKAAAQDDEITCEDLAPASVPAALFVGMGDAFFALGDQTLAIVTYSCAIERDATYAPAYVNRGFAHLIQHNDTAALDDFNQALTLDENLVSAYNNRGLLYLNQGNFGLAINDFTLAVALDPTYAIAYHNRALVHAAERNYDLALADLQEAIRLDPTYAAPHATLGAVYSALALASYQDYTALAGDRALVPGGEPDTIINTLAEGLETGNFAYWLTFWTPAH
jgi:tetratricopeptide (TPR) repeat protein